MKLHEWLKANNSLLAEYGIPSARLDAELILSECLDHTRTWLHAYPEYEISKKKMESANAWVARRSQREPLAYILGYKEFYGRKFKVTPDVLIPRPESETMIDLLKSLPSPAGSALIDIGTGSGCLGITAKLEVPELAVTLSDISAEALNIARRNAEALQAEVTLTRSDLLASFLPKAALFDVVLANLPYVDASWERSPETDYEPTLALFADDGGIALIKKLIQQTSTVLKPLGYVLLEADPEQHPAIIAYAQQNGLVPETVADYIVVLRKS